jgi:hypothetical protein
LRDSGKYISPVGASWRETEIDEAAVSRYRFDGTRHARLKAGLDAAAAAYLCLVVIALAVSKWPARVSGSWLLDTVSSSYALRPLLLDHLPRSLGGAWGEFVVFALVLCVTALHESRWLKLRIYYDYLQSPRSYRGFLNKDESSLTARQLLLTVASRLVNHLVVLGVVLMAAHCLWAVRLLPAAHNAVVLTSLVFAGMLLTVTGATSVIGALDGDDVRALPALARAPAGALVCGVAFAAVIALGLRRGWPGCALGFGFGFGLASSARVCRDLVVRPRRAGRRERPGRASRPAAYAPLIALGRLIDWLLARSLSIVSPRRKSRPRGPAESLEVYEQVGAGEGHSYGYLHRPEIVTPPATLIERIRARLLHRLLAENSPLTLWLKREPVRLRRGHLWDEEDPLDFLGRVRTVGGYAPPRDRVDMLYRRLLSLMLAAFAVAYVVEMLTGHVVASVGRPLLERGAWAAAIFGLGVGVLFAFVAVFGHSSFAALTLGLLSGLSLDPTAGLVVGLLSRLSRTGLIFVFTFALTLAVDLFDRRVQWIVGTLALAAGIYLQSLPFLATN